MITVRIVGWSAGLRKVSMSRTLHSEAGIGLAQAKSITERVLSGESVEIEVVGISAAETLSAALNELGAVSIVVHR